MKKLLILAICACFPLQNASSLETSPRILLKSKKSKKSNSKGSSESIIKKGLEFLASKQSGARFATGTRYIIDGQISAACMAGLAYTQNGNTFTKGEFSKNLKTLASGLAKQQLFPYKDRGRGNGGQFNWTTGFMLMFLSEASDAGGKAVVAGQINKLIALAKESQDSHGGWTHGKPGKNSLNYSDLAATSLVVLNGLAMAFQAGYDVPEEVLNKGFEYIKNCSAGMNVGYSPKKGQRGMAGAGRNGAAYSALRRTKRTKEKFIKQIQLNDTILGITGKGHADGMYHYFYVGVAAKNMGGDIWKKYEESYVSQIPGLQKSDGSFRMIPRTGKEKDLSTMGVIWDTAICLILLGLDENEGTTLADADKDKSKAALAEKKRKAYLAKMKGQADKIRAEIEGHEKKGDYKKAASALKKLIKIDADGAKGKIEEYKARIQEEGKKYDEAYTAQDFGYAYIGYQSLVNKYGATLATDAKAKLDKMKKDPTIKELIKLDKEIAKIKKKFDVGKGLLLKDLQQLHKIVKNHEGTAAAKRAQDLINAAKAKATNNS